MKLEIIRVRKTRMKRLAISLFICLMVLVPATLVAQNSNTEQGSASPEVSPTISLAESPAPLPSPTIQVIVQSPPKSWWSDLISPLAGLLGVLVGSLLAMRIQRAKIETELVEADRRYQLERIREIYSVTLALLDASRQFHQRFLELVRTRHSQKPDLIQLLVQARDAINPVRDAALKCFAFTFLDAREKSDVAKNIHDKTNDIYALMTNFLMQGGDNSLVLSGLEELDKMTNDHLETMSRLYAQRSKRNNRN